MIILLPLYWKDINKEFAFNKQIIGEILTPESLSDPLGGLWKKVAGGKI